MSEQRTMNQRDSTRGWTRDRGGVVMVLSAPSGAGKTTLAAKLRERMPEIEFAITYTTREPRQGEVDGVDYHFVDVHAFKVKIDRGEFIEWAEVHGNFYGSPRAPISRALERGGITVFVLDVQGGRAIKQHYPDAVLTFVLPPSLEELERRLRGRGTDTEATIHRRLLGARAEIEKGVTAYDYLIVNEELEVAYTELESVVRAERCRRQRVPVGRLTAELGLSTRDQG